MEQILRGRVLPNSISTCFKLPLFATFFYVWLGLLLLANFPSEKLSKNPKKVTDNPFCLFIVSIFSPLWLWQSLLSQWHVLAVIQSAAAKARHICASIKSVMLCWSRCPLWDERGDRTRQIEKQRRKKGGWECLKSKCAFFYEYEHVRESERGERERALAEDWLLTTWTSHISPVFRLLLLSGIFYSRFTSAHSLKDNQRQLPSWHCLTTIGVIYHWSFSTLLKMQPC